MEGNCASDKSGLIEISAGTEAQYCRREARKMAQKGKKPGQVPGTGSEKKKKIVGATSSHLPQKYAHTHTQSYTHRAHLPGRNIPGETRDAALAAVRVREM